jgi:hypothetical protein
MSALATLEDRVNEARDERMQAAQAAINQQVDVEVLGYPAKNFVREVITPDRREWRAIEQVPRPSGEESAAIQAGANSAIPAVVDKPDWAK